MTQEISFCVQIATWLRLEKKELHDKMLHGCGWMGCINAVDGDGIIWCGRYYCYICCGGKLDGVEWLCWWVSSSRDDGFWREYVCFDKHYFESNMAVQFAPQILPIDRSEPEASLAMTCASLAEGGIWDMRRFTWPLDVMVWPVGTSASMVG